MKNIFLFVVGIAVLMGFPGNPPASFAGDRGDATVEGTYPGLVMGILRHAQLASLESGVVLTAGDLKVSEVYLTGIVQNAESSLKAQLEKNLLFVLEQEITSKLLLNEALKGDTRKDIAPDKRITSFLQGKAEKVTVSEGELRTFYEQNKDAIGGAPFDQVKDSLQGYLLNEKKQRAIAEYIERMGREVLLRIDAAWLKKQYVPAMDNSVDRARHSGKPTMVEFGASGCRPCDMMQPILTNLRKKYRERLNVIFVQVRQEQILAARYGIHSIPVQAFFNGTGKEVFRHVGFFPQKQVEKIVARMGVAE
ncbi:MAG: thioredoxin family protein [Desulfatiglandaceae bacterium]